MSSLEQWGTDHNGFLAVVGTVLAVVDPMIATWFDGRRTIGRAIVFVVVAVLLGTLTNTDDVPVWLRLLSMTLLVCGLAVAVAIRIDRYRRGERAPVPCEALLDRQAIQRAGLRELQHAEHSFDLTAVSGVTILQDTFPDLKGMVARGVRLRVVLLDPESPSVDAFAVATGLTRTALQEQIRTSRKLLNDLKSAAEKTGRKGCVDWRFYDRLPFHSIWIVDKTAVNIQVFSYLGSAKYKAFRSGNRAIVKVIQDEFEKLWDPDFDSGLSR